MKIPLDANAVSDHVEQGIFAMVLRKEAFVQDPEGVLAIMVASNLEQAVAMPEHEIALMVRLRGLVKEPGGALQTHWETVHAAVLPMMGNRWSDDDVKAMYNFCMVAGDQAMDAITNLHFQWINPSIMAVKPTYFAAVAQLPHELLWVRACLIMAQYLCDENGYVKVGRP
jgi:hypothetical protein